MEDVAKIADELSEILRELGHIKSFDKIRESSLCFTNKGHFWTYYIFLLENEFTGRKYKNACAVRFTIQNGFEFTKIEQDLNDFVENMGANEDKCGYLDLFFDPYNYEAAVDFEKGLA